MLTLRRLTLKRYRDALKITNANFCNVAPLEGIRILDLTRIVAGPYCTMILGDLGAEIIKIERPGSGDEARKWGPPYIGDSSETCYFVCLNRSKKSICIDIKSDKGRSVIYDLAKISDVLVENYVPGKLDELQLGYGDLKQIAPHLVYCSITGYGTEGPYKHKPGYDAIASSVGGMLHITGPENGEPVKTGVASTDLATGLYAHGAILAALLKRSKTGKGQKIDCDLLSVQISSLINIGSNYLNAAKEAKRWGTAHASIVPYQAFKTKDGYYTVGAGSDQQFLDFCKCIGRPELASDPKYLTNNLRVTNRKELISILKEVFLQFTNKQWHKRFDGSSCPSGPVNSLQETFNDPHVQAINLVKKIQHPAGEIKLVGPPVVYSDGGNEIRDAPPTLGQHTDLILKSILDYDDKKINLLREEKVIQ